jgi:hypothetical protein
MGSGGDPVFKKVTRWEFVSAHDPEMVSLVAEIDRSNHGVGEMYGPGPEWLKPDLDEFFEEDDDPYEW